jgi:S1-C subfamily serine protease
MDPWGSGNVSDLAITFASGEIVAARVEWTAPEGIDLAIASASPTRPPRVVTRIRKEPLMVGDKTFAIGNPHSLSWTYTEGAVSRVHSKRTTQGDALEVVQMQTPIHPGNSGGGLYDATGRLVGINTWVIDQEGGPGFAISTKTVLTVLPENYASLAPVDAGEKAEGE